MNTPISTILLVGFLSLNASFSFGQKKISKKEQQQIWNTCEVYSQEHNKVISDYESPTDSLAKVSSKHLYDLILARRDFFEKMEFNMVVDELEIVELDLSDSVGCVISGEPNYKINVEKVDNRWVVIGFDNKTIDEESISQFNDAIQKDLDQLVVKDSIKELLKDFVEGWSEIRQSGKSDLLKSLTTSEFHDYIHYDCEYDRLRGFKPRKVSVKEVERVTISADTARCRVVINRLGGSVFTLLKQDGKWKVAGADRRVCSAQDVEDTKSKIEHYKELDKFNDRIGQTKGEFERFFKTGKSEVLSAMSTEKFMENLDVYRNLFGTVNKDYVGMRGLDESAWIESEFVLYGDTAYYKHYGDSIRWVKKDEKWLLDELFCSIESNNKFDKAYRTFDEFRSMMFVTYSVYNTFEDDDIESVVFPVAPPASEQEERKPVFRHRIDRYPQKEIEYVHGNDQLQKDLQKLTKKYKSKTSFEGVIYVEFHLENTGSAKAFKALNEAGTEQATFAEEIVSQLDGWKPFDSKYPIFTNVVVAIEF